MSNTNITNLEISDTFQVWINKTNEIIDLTNENVMLAGPGAGFTVEGNSTLIGSFTANTLNSNTLTSDSISIATVERKDDLSLPINFTSPVSITSNVENIFTVTTTAGNRPILRLVNGADARWAIGQSTSSASSPITIRLEGSTNPQLTLTQAGRLSVSELEGNGSLITNINANNISSGTFDVDRIPNLNASKITSGTFADARIPNLNASKITSGTLPLGRGVRASDNVEGVPQYNGHSISPGRFYGGNTNPSNAAVANRMNYDGPFHATSISASGNVSAATYNGYTPANAATTITGGIGLIGGGTLESNRTIDIDEATVAEAVAGSASNKTMTPRRTAAAITARAMPIGAVYIQFPGYSAPSSLFGGTWSAIFDNEGIFFRTPGGEALSFGGGIQLDQMQRITGQFNASQLYRQGAGNQNVTGAFRIGSPNLPNRPGTRDSRNTISGFSFDSNFSPNARVSSTTTGETRPRNRTVRVWVRTA